MNRRKNSNLSTEVESLSRIRKEIQEATAKDDFVSARTGLLQYLKLILKNPNEKPRLLVKLLGTYLSEETLKQATQENKWNEFKNDILKNDIHVVRRDIEELENYFKLLSINLMLDNLDNSIQLASLLRKDFERSDLAYSVIKPWIYGSHENHPYLNTTLLPILTERKMWVDAENAARRMMKFAPKVQGSLKFALPAYVSYLLTVFEDTGDLGYLTEVETILAIMELTKVELSFLLSCLSRYQRIIGDIDDSMISRKEARDADLSTSGQRNLSPSASKFLDNSVSGKEIRTWMEELVRDAETAPLP